MIARDLDGASCGWGSGTLTVTSPWEVHVKTDKEIYKKGETVQIAGQLKGAGAAKEVVVRVADATGRLLAEDKVPVVQGHFRHEYRIDDMKTAPHTVTAAIVTGGQEIVHGSVPFFVPDFGWHDYHNVLWAQNVNNEATELMRDDAGITAMMDSWQRDLASKCGASVGMRPSRINDAVLIPAGNSTQGPETFPVSPGRTTNNHRHLQEIRLPRILLPG